MIHRLILSATVLVVATTASLAQDVGGVQPIIDFSPLFQEFVVPIASVILTGLAGWLFAILKRKFGLDIEKGYRDAFQTAVANGAGRLLQSVGDRTKITVNSPQLAAAVNYVIAGAPDALAHFGITRTRIEETILAKIGLLEAAAPAPQPAVPMTDAAIGAAVARNDANR